MTRRLVLAALLAATALLAAPASADTPASAYRQAVADTLTIVESARPGDTAAAQNALSVLITGTGASQPEIIADLRAQPPDFNDAAARLRALLAAIDNPAATSDPTLAQQRLHDVLAMHRYDALRQPPSLFDRIGQWIQDRISQLLRAIFGGFGPGGVVPDWAVFAIALGILVAVAILVFRSTRGRLSGGAAAALPKGPQAPADYFAEADRLAAEGDRVGAVRALCAGVAATLAGERTGEGSPLTVRAIFRRAPDPASLTPLLRPFEAAVYGGRAVDQDAYDQAAAVAARYRAVPAEHAA